MQKADWVAKATELGIENAESFTVAELQAKIAQAEAANGAPPPPEEEKANTPPEAGDKSAENAKAPEEEKAGYKYPLYDLWKVDKEDLKTDKDGDPKKVKLIAVKILRKSVKIGDHVAEQLNGQSHNNLQRYYKQGAITNGNEETITVK